MKIYFVLILPLLLALSATNVTAQSTTAYERIDLSAPNQPLDSLSRVAEQGRNRLVKPGPPREVINFRGHTGPNAVGPDPDTQIAVVQTNPGTAAAGVVGGMGFDGTDNATNGSVLGFRIAPPDADGSIGGATGQYFVQMINLLTTIFDPNGNVLLAPFASSDIWSGIGGNCAAYNQGDPIVLYDDQADRWLFSQFAFPDNLGSFSQCVAVSQTDDPRGGYNRYEFSFSGIGFNDYPKHGIVSDSITLMANLFKKRGQNFSFAGTYLAVLNKAAMYAGQPASMRGFNIGTGQFGFVAGDLDGPGTADALFATAMSTTNALDIWRIDANWGGSSATISQIESLPVTPFNRTLCNASRGACIPQPDNGPALESLSDRLMHRLQIRDFGSYRAMLAAHTVNVGGGRAGIRWYEVREVAGDWSLYQEGTYAPDDGQYRWMPSIAMNGRGDIGMGFLLGGPNTFMSVSATGQTAAGSGTGLMDALELSCVAGGGVQTGTGRSGDYSSTSIDPFDDVTFWHTNEYVNVGGNFVWDTYVCPFTIGDGGVPPLNMPPTAVITAIDCAGLNCNFNATGSADSDGTIASYAWTFGDGGSGSGVSASHSYGLAGNYAVGLTVTDNDGATGAASTSITVNEPVAANSLSVTAITVTTLNRGGGSKSPRALVTIQDDQGSPVSGAVVNGDFTGSAAQSGVSGSTNSNGVATLTSSNTAKGKVSFTFCVTDVVGALTYNAAGNAQTCASL